MHTYSELKSALIGSGLSDKAVIAHALLKAFGQVNGVANSLVCAVLDLVGASDDADVYL